MAYVFISNGSAEYAVDWEVIDRLVHAYWKAEMQDRYCKFVTSSDSSWYNPFSWSLPELETLEVDWDVVRSKAKAAFENDRTRLRQLARNSVYDVAQEVLWKINRTKELREWFTDQLADMQKNNAANIETSVSNYDSKIAIAKFVRDTSFDTVAVGSTVVTGGAGAALLGGAAVLKGTAKYSDTSSIGAASMQVAGTLFFGVFKLGGASLTLKQEATLIIVQGGWESGMSLVAGKSVADAVTDGGLKIIGDSGAKLVSGLAKGLLSKVSVPVKVTTALVAEGAAKAADAGFGKTAAKVAEKIGASTIKKTLDPTIRNWVNGPKPAPASPEKQAAPRTGVAFDAIWSDTTLLKWAIVNQANGIGHGW